MREADFKQKDKDTLAKRVAFRCSNPECKMPTTGPNEVPDKSTNIGVASHIKAASSGGPRFDSSTSLGERKEIQNGIWLCQSCSVLIDRDVLKYSVELLLEWKRLAERAAAKELNVQLGKIKGSSVVSEFGYEPIEENSFYEKKFQGGTVRYYLRNGLIHVEHELEADCIAYYVIDEHGNLVDHKLPYPVEEYTVEISPDWIIREQTSIVNGIYELKEYELKWGKKAKIYRHKDGRLANVELIGGGGAISNRDKKFYFTSPEFKS